MNRIVSFGIVLFGIFGIGVWLMPLPDWAKVYFGAMAFIAIVGSIVACRKRS